MYDPSINALIIKKVTIYQYIFSIIIISSYQSILADLCLLHE